MSHDCMQLLPELRLVLIVVVVGWVDPWDHVDIRYIFDQLHNFNSPVAFLPESDSEDELPPGWEERATVQGRSTYLLPTHCVYLDSVGGEG